MFDLPPRTQVDRPARIQLDIPPRIQVGLTTSNIVWIDRIELRLVEVSRLSRMGVIVLRMLKSLQQLIRSSGIVSLKIIS